MAADPYRYFRVEARELLQGLNQGVLDLEKGPAGVDLVNRLLRQAHTLKGASRIVKQSAIGDMAHGIEDALAPYRDGGARVPRELIDAALGFLDRIAVAVKELDAPYEAQGDAPAQRVLDDLTESVRVDLGEVDELLEDLTATNLDLAHLERDSKELRQTQGMARRLAFELKRATAGGANGSRPVEPGALRELADDLDSALTSFGRSLDNGLDRIRRDLIQVREEAIQLRLLPAGMIFAPLERAARDAAQALGRRVVFQTSGGEYRIDSHALAALRGALMHVVRNAVAHGIEPESARVAAGKPPAGVVDLTVQRRQNRVAFLCRDDGRGIDIEAVRQAALRSGLVPAEDSDSLDEGAIAKLVLRGGVTTTGEVTDVSGRGVGLDVVRETVARLKGEVSIQTERGRGTTIEITVPVSLSSLPAVLANVGGLTVAIPLDAVVAVRRVAEAKVVRSAEGESVIDGDDSIPVLDLRALFAAEPESRSQPSSCSVVIVRSGAERVAARVDSVGGVANVVVRRVPASMAADPVVGGASLGPDGWPQIVLDTDGLVHAAHFGGLPSSVAPSPRPPLLVIDDSLTTRMLEQSILESMGYEVDLATSGEEALAMARGRRYGVFLVDIEMPGMSGLEFMAQAKADPTLRDVASILVTSLNSEEDRRRGEQLGARAYIVKNEFDQGRLLDIIREMIG